MSETKHEMVRYVALKSPVQGMQLAGKTFYAVDGVLTLTKVHADELDELMEGIKHGPRPDIVQSWRKIDEKAALEIVRHHQASLKPGATKGVVHSGSPMQQSQAATHANAHPGSPTAAAIPPTLQGATRGSESETLETEEVNTRPAPPLPDPNTVSNPMPTDIKNDAGQDANGKSNVNGLADINPATGKAWTPLERMTQKK